jgi:hypothetical protein
MTYRSQHGTRPDKLAPRAGQPAPEEPGKTEAAPAHFADHHRPPEQAARRGRAERHHQLRCDDGALAIEPPAAPLDLVRPAGTNR